MSKNFVSSKTSVPIPVFVSLPQPATASYVYFLEEPVYRDRIVHEVGPAAGD